MPDIVDLRVHTTDRQSFKNCRLRWNFSSNLRLGYKPRRRVPEFTFGSAWHEAMASYYTTVRSIPTAQGVFQGAMLSWFQSIENPTEEDEEEFTEGLRLGLGMLEHYGAWAPKHDHFDIEWVETTFNVKLFGDQQYSLTPDGLVRDAQGRFWILEHKTARSLPDQTDYLLMDEQVGSYIWGLHEATGVWAEGVIYTIARKKLPTPSAVLKSGDLSMRKDADTTYEYALAQIKEHHQSVPSKYDAWLDSLELRRNNRMSNNGFFLREIVRRNRDEITFLAKQLEVEGREMTDPNIAIYRNPNRFNCSNCAYVGPCLAYYEGGDWKTMLEGNYDQGNGRA